jgi:hypothetical protein
MRVLLAGVLAAGLAACGSASGGLPAEALGVTARDAYLEARSMARAWSGDVRLRYVQGADIASTGQALPDQGSWSFHYTAPGKTGELLVRVTPLATTTEERALTSPPGYVIGDNALGTSWLDSPAVLQAVLAEGAAPGTADLLLVPTRPERWVVRMDGASERWQVHAGTGEVLAR